VYFVDPEADIPYYEQVGVLPFATLSQDRAAGLRTTSVFFTELLRLEYAVVIEPGQFEAAMSRVRGNVPAQNPWSTKDLARLGEETGTQAFFMGTVQDYGTIRAGQKTFPMISLEVRMVDAASGRLVWSASGTAKGGPGFPVFGWGEVHTQSELTGKLCRDLLGTLP
jgi:TolB-like protein